MNPKKMFRSANRMIAGVCGGFAEYFEVDPTIIRVAMAFFIFFTGILPGVLFYFILMLIMPNANA
jgi:phage shock protein PspC (stress-responsive transcriptional regulator)